MDPSARPMENLESKPRENVAAMDGATNHERPESSAAGHAGRDRNSGG